MKVRNHNGAEIDISSIPDLWHIAMSLPDEQQKEVLKVWHQAHAMKDTLCEREKAGVVEAT